VFAKEIKQDTTVLLHDTAEIKMDTEDILAEIARLRVLITHRPMDRDSNFLLNRYLDELTSFSGSVSGDAVDFSAPSRPRYVRDPPIGRQARHHLCEVRG